VARTIYRHVAEGESRLPTEGHAFKPGSPGAAKRGPSAPLRAADFDEELFLERPNCSRKFSLKRFLRRFRRKALADEIYELLKQVSALTEFKKEMAIIAIIYIERLLKRHPTLCLTKGNWRPVLVAALHLASKTWEDVHAWNADFANYLQVVLGLRYPVRNLHQLEVKMLMGLDYHMEVCGELYASYYFALTEDLRASQTSAGRGNDSLLASSLGLCPSTLEGNSTLASERDRSSNPGSPTPSSASSQRATWNRSLLSSVKARRMSRTSSQATFLNSLSPQDEVPDAQSGFCPVRLDAVNPYVGYFRHAPRAQAPSTYLAIASDGLAGTLPTRPTRTKSAAELLRS